ncbi:MAG: acetyl-CoA hydrolase/transferase C-terminal domain-containing protein [Sterolibacterium sp.]
MDALKYYESKLITADHAASFVQSGDYVVFTSGREAQSVGLAISARKEELQGVRVLVSTPTFDFGWYDEGWDDSFEITIRMPTGTCQDAIDARRVDFDPGGVIPFVEINDMYKADVLLTEVSPPDKNGFCSFGASVWAKRRQIENAKLVIAEVNDRLIRTYGDNYVHVSEIDYFVEHQSSGEAPGGGSLAGRALKAPEPYLNDIKNNVASLLRDGDTIQIGVGRTTEPLVRMGLFNGRNDLGWHSEATPPGVISLVREGVINGKRKTVNQGKVVVTSIGGSSKEEMSWVDQNPMFHLIDVADLEDIRLIAAHDNMVAINNALAVDLMGQSTAETIENRWLAQAGGQLAFALGALFSKGGRSILILPSTAKNGTVSRIVPALAQGTVTTLTRNMSDYVVTEYGVASLRGRSLRQRANALIEVAHPKFRDELKQQAKELLWP